jgi:hypothetical protein
MEVNLSPDLEGKLARAAGRRGVRWGSKAPADLSTIHQPVLVANGARDRMVPSVNTHDLARRLPNSDLIIDPDSGHGAVFQFHADLCPRRSNSSHDKSSGVSVIPRPHSQSDSQTGGRERNGGTRRTLKWLIS